MGRACDAGAEQVREKDCVYSVLTRRTVYRQTLLAQTCLKMLKHLLVMIQKSTGTYTGIAHFVGYLTSMHETWEML